MRVVKYSLWRNLSCSISFVGEVSTEGWVDWFSGVCGRELLLEVFVCCVFVVVVAVVVFSGRNDDCPLLTMEPLRDMYGELEALASTHSSSGSSPPMSKVTCVLFPLCWFIPVPLEDRCSLSEEERLWALVTSPCERFRFSRLL